MEYAYHLSSPLGGITLCSDGEALTGLRFDGQKHFAEGLGPDREERALPVFEEAERWLAVYFSGREPDFTPPLRFASTPFREAVWRAMLAIPYGETVTYGQIADALTRQGISASPRAVGAAAGRNPILLIVPCHRVVGRGGALTGYAAGLERKRFLLEWEQK